MSSIHTLLPDVQQLLREAKGTLLTVELELKPQVPQKKLRMSKLGPTCPRALWYSYHHPELAEPLPPWAEMKFAFGHMMEALALKLAKEAGHRIEGEQDEILLDGVSGHRDAIIDGVTVDLKSCSSRAFSQFKSGNTDYLDGWGYLSQLDGYVVGSIDDSLVTSKDKGLLWAIDKTLGHMVLYEHIVRIDEIRNRIANYKAVVAEPSPPRCSCGTAPEGASGNIGLDVKGSYNSFKWECFPHLRCFLYANGPKYLTKVVRLPDVQEVNKHGQLLY